MMADALENSNTGQPNSPMLQRGAEVALESVYDIPVEISVVLGKTSMTIDQLLRMGTGAVVELQRKVGEPVDVYVNGRIVARGEVVIVEDKIGITMTEMIKMEA
jgi:flagellar motor switch protein FliN